jgi:hypothetical protein
MSGPGGMTGVLDLADAPESVIDALELVVIRARRRPANKNSALRKLNEDSIEEYVQMVIAGTGPSIGWWRRHLPSPQRPELDL